MRVRWFGQSAFALSGSGGRVLIDPFGDMSSSRRRWDYAAVRDVACDLLVVTHEHPDHNHVASAAGEPHTVRSTAGTFSTPIGEVVSVASEHDPQAGTARGHNTMVRFVLDDLRIAHLGDLGQAALRPEQIAALGAVDLLFVPVGGHATIGAAAALEVVRVLQPRWVVPMHYRTPAIDFLDPVDAFLDGFGAVERWASAAGDISGHLDGPPIAVVPAVPS